MIPKWSETAVLAAGIAVIGYIAVNSWPSHQSDAGTDKALLAAEQAAFSCGSNREQPTCEVLTNKKMIEENIKLLLPDDAGRDGQPITPARLRFLFTEILYANVARPNP